MILVFLRKVFEEYEGKEKEEEGGRRKGERVVVEKGTCRV